MGAPPGTPTGTATFFDGATPITCDEGSTSIQPLNGSGAATCTTSTLSVAGSPHSITATYNGDANYLGSTSNTVSQTVNACDNPAIVTKVTPDDGSSGTLRYALVHVCDGGTITFQAALTGTITLTTGQLEIDKNVTITGPGAAVITVTANNSGRVFNVQSGKTASISGLTIAGGNVVNANQGGLGGGIYINSAGSLTLTNCVVSGNKALDTNGGGGGSYNGGTLILLGTTFSGNQSALEGGAIRNDGTLSLTNSTISGNTAGTSGAAIQNGGPLMIDSSTLSGNTASGDGGAIRNDYAAGTVVTLTATPSANFLFDSWTGDCSGSGACSVTMNASKSVTATFKRK